MTDKAKSLEKLNQPEEPNLVVTRSPISELNSRKRQLVPEPSSPPRPGAVCWNTPQEPIQKENGQVALALPGQPRHSGASGEQTSVGVLCLVSIFSFLIHVDQL